MFLFLCIYLHKPKKAKFENILDNKNEKYKGW